MFAKGDGIGQIFFKGSSANATIHGKPGEKIFNCLLVIQFVKLRNHKADNFLHQNKQNTL
jgi:hypothetical protein